VLCGILVCELAYFLIGEYSPVPDPGIVSTKQVGIALFGPYALGVELASMLLLAGLVGAYHLGKREQP
jgi:NADH-quinone oxidoreductase subunit J